MHQDASKGVYAYSDARCVHVVHDVKKSGVLCMLISRVVRVSTSCACVPQTLPTFLSTAVYLLYYWCDMSNIL